MFFHGTLERGGRIKANSISWKGKRPNQVGFKVRYDLQKGGFVLKYWRQNFRFEFWTIFFFVLLCLSCSCRADVCILNSTESTNGTKHTSDWQARSFASVANSIFENLEGNFQTKQNKTKRIYKMIQSWVSEKKEENFMSVRSTLSGGFPERRLALFTSWAHGSLALGCSAYLSLPNDLCRTATVWVVL